MNIVSSHATHAILSIFPPISAVPVAECSNSSNVICPRQVHPLFRIICTVFLLLGLVGFSIWGGREILFVCSLFSSACGPKKKGFPSPFVFVFVFFFGKFGPRSIPLQVVDGKLHDFICQRFAVVASRESIYNFGWNLCRKWIRYFSAKA